MFYYLLLMLDIVCYKKNISMARKTLFVYILLTLSITMELISDRFWINTALVSRENRYYILNIHNLCNSQNLDTTVSKKMFQYNLMYTYYHGIIYLNRYIYFS